jgi:hypothetical protein
VKDIIVLLQGGIGNQLFQWGFADRLARLCGARISFNLERFQVDSFGRSPVIQRLLPDANITPLRDIPPQGTRVLSESKGTLLESGAFPEVFEFPAGVERILTEGYWQDARYVDPYFVEQVRGRLAACVSQSPTDAFAAQQEKMALARFPIAVHVRRHDYHHHGVCDGNYYIESLRWLLREYGEGEGMVFSDEPNYTHRFFQEAGLRFQMVQTRDDLQDLYWMSQCRAHVISNSTYSWWGAVISGASEVIYPAPWSYVHRASPHLCPAQWKCVPEAVRVPRGELTGVSAVLDAQKRAEWSPRGTV